MIVYKYFKEESHKNEFLAGNIRFGSLAYYQAIEDSNRSDVNEGKIVYHVDNCEDNNVKVIIGEKEIKCISNLTATNEIVNPELHFIFSTSTILSEELKEKFGYYCVAIKEPSKLSKAIQKQGADFIKDYIQAFNIYLEEKSSSYSRTNKEKFEVIKIIQKEWKCIIKGTFSVNVNPVEYYDASSLQSLKSNNDPIICKQDCYQEEKEFRFYYKLSELSILIYSWWINFTFITKA